MKFVSILILGTCTGLSYLMLEVRVVCWRFLARVVEVGLDLGSAGFLDSEKFQREFA